MRGAFRFALIMQLALAALAVIGIAQARVRFAVCTPENCVPDERTLALVLPVQ